MVDGQRIPRGAHAQNLNTAFKALRNEQEPAPTLPRQMVATIAGAWLWKRRFAPNKQMDAQVDIKQIVHCYLILWFFSNEYKVMFMSERLMQFLNEF